MRIPLSRCQSSYITCGRSRSGGEVRHGTFSQSLTLDENDQSLLNSRPYFSLSALSLVG
jgi:hypothetical protein